MSCGPILSVSLHLAFPLHLPHLLSCFWVNRKFYKKSSGGLSHVPLWTGDEQSRTWTMFQGLTWLCWDICEPVKHLSLPPHPSEHHLARLLTCTLHRSSSNQQCRRSLICTALSCLLQHFLWPALKICTWEPPTRHYRTRPLCSRHLQATWHAVTAQEYVG